MPTDPDTIRIYIPATVPKSQAATLVALCTGHDDDVLLTMEQAVNNAIGRRDPDADWTEKVELEAPIVIRHLSRSEYDDLDDVLDDVINAPVDRSSEVDIVPTAGYQSCRYTYDGTEDGIDWYRCTVHDKLSMGTDVSCEGAAEDEVWAFQPNMVDAPHEWYHIIVDDDVERPPAGLEVSGSQCGGCGLSQFTINERDNGTRLVAICLGEHRDGEFHDGCQTEHAVKKMSAAQVIFG